jgi:ATP-binding cassette subfamily B protein
MFAHPELEGDRLREVADIANLSGDVEGFPDGFRTWVGERGITLSGGQKQRTSLARALAANPRVLILDDCLSSVDTRTESEILRKLRPHLKDRTTIIIAHRISTLQWTDQIIVIKDGKISERGTHAELLSLGGWYTTMYYRQLLEASLAEEVK